MGSGVFFKVLGQKELPSDWRGESQPKMEKLFELLLVCSITRVCVGVKYTPSVYGTLLTVLKKILLLLMVV